MERMGEAGSPAVQIRHGDMVRAKTYRAFTDLDELLEQPTCLWAPIVLAIGNQPKQAKTISAKTPWTVRCRAI